jgi:hypothetical protein
MSLPVFARRFARRREPQRNYCISILWGSDGCYSQPQCHGPQIENAYNTFETIILHLRWSMTVSMAVKKHSSFPQTYDTHGSKSRRTRIHYFEHSSSKNVGRRIWYLFYPLLIGSVIIVFLREVSCDAVSIYFRSIVCFDSQQLQSGATVHGMWNTKGHIMLLLISIERWRHWSTSHRPWLCSFE